MEFITGVIGPLVSDPNQLCRERYGMECEQWIRNLASQVDPDAYCRARYGDTCAAVVMGLAAQLLNDPLDPGPCAQLAVQECREVQEEVEQCVQTKLCEPVPLDDLVATACAAEPTTCSTLMALAESCVTLDRLCPEVDLLVEMLRAIAAVNAVNAGGDVNLTPYDAVYFAPDDASAPVPDCIGPCGPTCARRWFEIHYYWSETNPGVNLRAHLFWCWEKGEVTYAEAGSQRWVSNRAEKVVDVYGEGQDLDSVCDAGKCKMYHTVARWRMEYTYCSGKPPNVKCDSYHTKHPLIRISGFSGGGFENSGKPD